MPAEGVDLTMVLAYTVGLIVVYLLFRLLWLPAKFLLRATTAVIVGAVSIGLLNLLGPYVGLHVPFNALSVLGAGFLGLPGIALVIALNGLL